MTAPMDLYAPFDTGAGADVTESMWRSFMRNLRDDGVIATRNYPPEDPSELRVFADSSGMQVKVEPGECWIQAHWGEITSTETLPITAADPNNPRVDLVVARADFIANVVELDVKAGTPTELPSAPGLQQDTSAWEIPLAEVFVATNEFTISAGDVTDKRRRVGNGLFNEETPVLWAQGDPAGEADQPVGLGSGSSSRCRWFLTGKILQVRYSFQWGDPPYNGQEGAIFTRLPFGLKTPANQGYQRLTAHLWSHQPSATPVDEDWFGSALVFADSEFIFPFFNISGSNARISWYQIADSTHTQASGCPLVSGGYPEGGALTITGTLEVA